MVAKETDRDREREGRGIDWLWVEFVFVYCRECVRVSLVFSAPCVFSCLFQFCMCVGTALESVRSVSVMYEPSRLPLMEIHTFAFVCFLFLLIII